MPERTSYEPGTPSWVDLATPDPDASKRFYKELFGWEAEDSGPVEETGGYAFFTLGGKRVAGVSPLMSPDQPVVWSTYVSTDDVDGVAQRAAEAGAMVVAPPMDVMDAGRMTFFVHPAGGAIGAWQPGTHKGAEIVNDPNSFSWSELQTRDVDAAKAFGSATFGWGYDERDFGGGMTYTIVQVGDDGVGGMAAMQPSMPEGLPAFWLTYFSVDDCDGAVEKVKALGGAVRMEPMEAEGVGRFAVVADQHGAGFGVIKNAQPA